MDVFRLLNRGPRTIPAFERLPKNLNSIRMNKTAQTDIPLQKFIAERWSPRSFSAHYIEKEKLQRMFEAARWSASASNEQPWRFILGEKGSPVYDKLFSVLVEFNQLWAGTAPVLVLTLAKKTNNNNPNKQNVWAIYDLGQAVAQLTFQATADGLFVHQMGGFDAQKAAQLFEIPDDFSIVTVVAIGYLGQPEALHPNLTVMELAQRQRVPLNRLVFGDVFGVSSDAISNS